MTCPVQFDSERKIWWNSTEDNSFLCDQPLGQLLLDRLNELDPNSVLEINDDNGNKWSASDVRRLSIICAQNYLKLGVRQGDVVLFCCSLNSYTTPTVFGCYLVGAIVYPIDVDSSEDDLEFSFSITEPKIILCDGSAYEKILPIVDKLKLLHLKHVLSFHSRDDKKTVPDVILQPVDSTTELKLPEIEDPEHIIAALLSSYGSTGRPKISVISQTVMIHAVKMWWHAYPMDNFVSRFHQFEKPITVNSSSVIYYVNLFHWVGQIVIMIQSALYGFVRVITSKTHSGKLNARIVQEHRITHIFGIPSILIDLVESAKAHDNYMDSIQVVLTGGERISASICSQLKQVIPKCKVVKIYGMTEMAGPISSNGNVKDYEGNGGYLAPGISAKILDRNMKPLDCYDRGKIYLKNRFMFAGYWNKDGIIEEVFDEDGWFNSGDFGYVDDRKLLHITDRYKEIVISDGKMIFPSVIEQLLEQHTYIHRAFVVGLPHTVKGQVPVALIQLETPIIRNSKVDDKIREEILEYLATQIAEDQMPFGGLYFVEKLPSKVYRPSLKEIAIKLTKHSKKIS